MSTESTAAARSGPLEGIRVLDLTGFLSGPYGTQILGDLGAEVLKVEPAAGDNSRSVPPHRVNGESVYYLSTNRNKKSIVLDLKSEDDRATVIDLIQRSHIVMENFRPGALERLGLDYESIRPIAPHIIWCAISGFGQTGPYRDRPAYDMIVQAYSGGMSLTGERGGAPVRAGIPVGDLTAGLYGVIAVLAALEQSRTTGEGDYIDISMLDCQLAMLSYQGAYYLNSGEVPGPQGRSHDSIPTYRCFTAGDGIEVAVTANTEGMWQALCRTIGAPELVEDPRFATLNDRHHNRTILEPILEQAFLSDGADAWVESLTAAGVPVAPVNTLDRALGDRHVLDRGMVVDLVGDDDEDRVRVVGDPIRFRSRPGQHHSYPPKKDEHADEIRAIADDER